jgi:hypothetical protein
MRVVVPVCRLQEQQLKLCKGRVLEGLNSQYHGCCLLQMVLLVGLLAVFVLYTTTAVGMVSSSRSYSTSHLTAYATCDKRMHDPFSWAVLSHGRCIACCGYVDPWHLPASACVHVA